MIAQHQHIDCLRKGLVMTLFTDDNNLVKNLGLFFGDGKITIVRKDDLGEGKTQYLINVKSTPLVYNQYDRTFVITCRENNYLSFYKHQITDIDEC